MRFFFWNIVIIIFSTHFLFGQSPDIKFEYITVNEGLPENTVQAMFQDHLGYMWFGTYNGLVRFDGVNYKTYYSGNENSNSFKGGSIKCIQEDSKGCIWVSGSNGLTRFDRRNNQFTRFLPVPDSLFTSNYLNDFASFQKDSLDNFWLTTIKGRLYFFDIKNEKFQRIGESVLPPVNTYFFNLKSTYIAKSGIIWLSTQKGLWAYNHVSKELKPYYNSADVHSGANYISTVAEDKDGNIWTGTKGGLYSLNTKTGKIKSFKFQPENPDGMKNDTCRVWINLKNEIWISTPGYISFLNPRTGKFKHFATGNSRMHYIVFEEPNGDFWLAFLNLVTTSLMPAYFSRESGKITLYEKNPTIQGSYGSSNFASFLKDHSGTYWFGSWGDGISHFIPANNRFNRYNERLKKLGAVQQVTTILQSGDTLWIGTTEGLISYHLKTFETQRWDKKNGLSDNYISSLYKEGSHFLWVGTSYGLDLIDLRNGRIKKIKIKEDTKQIISQGSILAILKDSRSNYWLSVYGEGVVRLKLRNKESLQVDEFKVYRSISAKKNTLSDNRIFKIIEDSRNRIWLTAYGISGLNLYRPETDDFVSFINKESKFYSFYDLLEDKSGNFWVPTQYGGLQLFNPESGKSIKIFNRANGGLPEDCLKGIVKDDNDKLWIISEKGLCKFDPNTGESRLYTEKDGLVKKYKFFFYPYINRSGEIYYGGEGGISVFHPDSLMRDTIMPKLRITSFYLMNKNILPSDEDSPIDKIIEETDEIVLPYNQNVFTLEYSALHYTNPEKMEFFCQMKGLDKDWQNLGNRRFVNYSGLQPGKYTFLLKARNSDGVWSSKILSLNIIIRAPWWNTWWAYLVYIFVFTTGILFYINIRTKVLKKRQQELTMLVKHRTNEVVKKNEELGVLNKEITSQRDELELLNQTKDKFFSIIAHDLRGPIGNLNSFLTLLTDEDEELSQNQRVEYLAVLKKSSKNTYDLLSNLLAWASSQKNEIAFLPTKNLLFEIVQSNIDLFLSTAANKKIIFQNEVPKEICAFFDKDMVHTIFRNLLNNAIKYSFRSGTIIISAKEAGRFVEISIRDFGVGMAQATIENLFRFDGNKVSVKGTSGEKGSGLGLILCREFIEKNGGRIWAESIIGKGSEFKFMLPAFENRE